ncbi:MAG TPA: PilZ domain-containing protein [Chromatiaceae bacterium]|jgi:type IV pilus assembly protein PilZ|nr:PilZ domain-containing protein [Chromatiaceae bacterium]
MDTPSSRPPSRILNFAFTDKNSLYAAYMPFIQNGGIFIANSRRYALGDDIFLILKLLDDPDSLPIAGKIVWVTPPGAEGGRVVGIGIQFGTQDKGAARRKIESLLAGMLESDRPTMTM